MNLNQFSSSGKLQDRVARLVYTWLTSDVNNNNNNNIHICIAPYGRNFRGTSSGAILPTLPKIASAARQKDHLDTDRIYQVPAYGWFVM